MLETLIGHIYFSRVADRFGGGIKEQETWQKEFLIVHAR